ncbi:MAG: hypothetical protein KA184_04640 [Candidatus Hydrogenedentes bacterium]|nr:hypothetical protein [Candidatus Hydrogenedentota bacterium]
MARGEPIRVEEQRMVKATFHHFGVPTSIKKGEETYLEGGKVYITDPEKHPFRVEFLRFDADSPLPAELQSGPHAAFLVDSLDEALKDQEVILPPFDATAELRCAFIKDGDALIEVMEKR